jgi:protein-L-isoaspartate(D-aspartate) O-methyltransferase
VDRLADFRRVFAEVVVARADCRDPAIRDALTRVPRHELVGPGPWYFTEKGEVSESSDPAMVYQDVGIGLARDRGIPTGLPSLHARCIAACRVKAGERVTHVGAGTGYFTAILAELIGERGNVAAFEIDAELAARARENLLRWPWVRVEPSPWVAPAPSSRDLVYVSAGVEELPLEWLRALAPEGRLLFPLVPRGEEGAVLLVRRTDSETRFSAEFVCGARFVPCVGTENEELGKRLSEAFRRGDVRSLRSLRIGTEHADESAWVSGRGWWLSTRAASAG